MTFVLSFQYLHMMKKTHTIPAVICLILLISYGCGDDHPKRSTVTGKVTYNSKPISIGSLVFVPVGGGPAAQGKIARDGSYEMGTFDRDNLNDGVIPGKYKVMITALTSPGGSGLPEDEIDGNSAPVSVIPEWYGDLEKSGLLVTVVADKANTIDFPLTDDKPKDNITR